MNSPHNTNTKFHLLVDIPILFDKNGFIPISKLRSFSCMFRWSMSQGNMFILYINTVFFCLTYAHSASTTFWFFFFLTKLQKKCPERKLASIHGTPVDFKVHIVSLCKNTFSANNCVAIQITANRRCSVTPIRPFHWVNENQDRNNKNSMLTIIQCNIWSHRNNCSNEMWALFRLYFLSIRPLESYTKLESHLKDTSRNTE